MRGSTDRQVTMLARVDPDQLIPARLQCDLLFKWFLGLNVEDEAFDHSSFAKNRERPLEH